MRALLTLLALAVPLSAQPTYSREVSRILQEKCQTCHRPGDIAPFALPDYEAAQVWAADIARVVEARIMPPWKPVPGHGDFAGNFGLTEEERQTILDWVAAGAPQGDPADLPVPIDQPAGDWQLGAPDHVLSMAVPFAVPRVRDLYRCFVLPTHLNEQQFLESVEVQPGNREIVHHVLLYLDESGEADKLDAADPAPGYDCFGGPGVPLGIGSMLGGWVPGARAARLPAGIGINLPGKARVVMQIHYNGGMAEDLTRVGLYFSRGGVERRLLFLPLVNMRFLVAPGEVQDVEASFTIPPFFDAKLHVIAPHMHQVGRQIGVKLQHRDQREESLVRIDDWDFNWQGFYRYREPVPLPAGATVRMTCTFDNTANNPRNPNNPLVPLRWGEGTNDEMCLTYLGVTVDRENLLPFTGGSRR